MSKDIKNLIYKYGHLYEKDTGKRVILKDGAELSIDNHTSQYDFDDTNIKPQEPYSDLQIENILNQRTDSNKYLKILERDSELLFEITLSLTKYSFTTRLRDSLYIYAKNDIKDYRLADCHCVVTKESSNKITSPYFEEIHAKSLNEVYKKTYVHYFSNKGSAACNAFDRFQILPAKVLLRKYVEDCIQQHRKNDSDKYEVWKNILNNR